MELNTKIIFYSIIFAVILAAISEIYEIIHTPDVTFERKKSRAFGRYFNTKELRVKAYYFRRRILLIKDDNGTKVIKRYFVRVNRNKAGKGLYKCFWRTTINKK